MSQRVLFVSGWLAEWFKMVEIIRDMSPDARSKVDVLMRNKGFIVVGGMPMIGMN